MKALGRYSIAAVLLVAAVSGVLWLFLDDAGRRSLMVAVAITLPVQLGLFMLLIPAVGDQSRFLVRWGMGVLARMAVVAAVGLSLPRLGGLNGEVLILSVCGFFFALLLLEPAFFRSQGTARFAP